MGQAIGDLLPFALGAALSPIPIIAVILMLLSKRAGANAGSFLVGWVVGMTVASIVLFAVSTSIGSGTNGAPSTSSSVIKLVAGVGLLLLARRSIRKRPKPGETAELPKWLASVETLTPTKAAALGVLLSALNPKNLLMIAGAMVALSQYHLPDGDTVVAIAVFVLVAVSTVVAPVVIFAVAGSKASRRLETANVWLGQNNATVMAVLLLVIGVVLIGKGIGGLSS